jgi:deoxycytidylate deaminase
VKTRQSITALCFDRRGKLVSVGRNNYTKTHPIQKKFADKAGIPQKIYLHAEIDALIKAKQGPIYRMVIVRKNKDGVSRPSMPCPVCEEAIKAFGVKKVEYTL